MVSEVLLKPYIMVQATHKFFNMKYSILFLNLAIYLELQLLILTVQANSVIKLVSKHVLLQPQSINLK